MAKVEEDLSCYLLKDLKGGLAWIFYGLWFIGVEAILFGGLGRGR
jgi:hypothetical protein